MTGINVASVGECMIEFSKLADGRWDMGFAGDTFNTLWALRALLPADARTDYLTAFGDDPFSDAQKVFFQANRIGTANSPTIPGARPGLYAITLDGYERSFTYWRSAAAARRLADDAALLQESLRGRDLVYFSGITLAILGREARVTLLKSIASAREAGATVAFDPNYRSQLWPDVTEARVALTQALLVVDVALPTFDDENALFGDITSKATVDRMLDSGVREVVVKCGAKAAFYTSADAHGEIAPAAVDEPVDTSGAGDAFNGGYLSARLLGEDIVAAVKCGHHVAGSAVRTRGALIRV